MITASFVPENVFYGKVKERWASYFNNCQSIN